MTAPLVTRSQSDCDQIDYTPSGAAAVGAVVVSNDLLGIVPSGRAGAGIEAGELGALQVDEGPWVFPKTAGGGTAIALGKTVFWDVADGVATADGTLGRRIGVCSRAALDADTTVEVLKSEPGPGVQAATVAAVATANATDLASSEALANQLKTTVNAILTNLKAVGLMASS